MKKVIPILLLLMSSLVVQSQVHNTLTVILNDSTDTTLDGTTMMIGSWADSIDLNDARKMINPYSENIAIGRNITFIAIERRTTRVTTSVPAWNLRKNKLYHIGLGNYDFPWAAMFEDTKTGRVIPFIKDSMTIYDFVADTCNEWHRFKITFPCVLALDTTPPVRTVREKALISVYPNPATDNFYIKGLSAGKHKVTITGFNFQKVFNVIGDGLKPILITHNIKQKGLYYVTFENQTKAILIQ